MKASDVKFDHVRIAAAIIIGMALFALAIGDASAKETVQIILTTVSMVVLPLVLTTFKS